jgi:hypothetical protein
MKKVLFIVITIAVSTAIPFVLAEITLRFLPVSTSLFGQPVNETSPVFRFLPDRDYLWSRDWNFSIVNGGHVNSSGFVSDRDYETDTTSPLLAVIGDSYVEATMLPYAETLQGRLAAKVARHGRVCSFAASAAPLSQYLAWARHAREIYRPDAMVFVIVGNDFDESLLAYRQWPGFHHYAEDAGGMLKLIRIDYEPNPWRVLVQHSALARYLLFNLQVMPTLVRTKSAIGEHWKRLTSADSDRDGGEGTKGIARKGEGTVEGRQYLGNVPRVVKAKRVADAKRAIDAFFRDLLGMAGLAPARILFVVDGVRYPSVTHNPDDYFIYIRRYFMARAKALDYGAIDMDHHFLPENEANGTRFEFPTDGHWNAAAHGLAAKAVADTDLFKRNFAAPADGKP